VLLLPPSDTALEKWVSIVKTYFITSNITQIATNTVITADDLLLVHLFFTSNFAGFVGGDAGYPSYATDFRQMKQDTG